MNFEIRWIFQFHENVKCDKKNWFNIKSRLCYTINHYTEISGILTDVGLMYVFVCGEINHICIELWDDILEWNVSKTHNIDLSFTINYETLCM